MATSIGMIPGTLLYVYIGSLVTASTDEAASSRWVWRGFVLFTAVVAVAYLAKIARKAIRNQVPPGTEPVLPSEK
jgi:uncharacterized membrane protein YdjX (TVP38/TMEM64 family)